VFEKSRPHFPDERRSSDRQVNAATVSQKNSENSPRTRLIRDFEVCVVRSQTARRITPDQMQITRVELTLQSPHNRRQFCAAREIIDENGRPETERALRKDRDCDRGVLEPREFVPAREDSLPAPELEAIDIRQTELARDCPTRRSNRCCFRNREREGTVERMSRELDLECPTATSRPNRPSAAVIESLGWRGGREGGEMRMRWSATCRRSERRPIASPQRELGGEKRMRNVNCARGPEQRKSTTKADGFVKEMESGQSAVINAVGESGRPASDAERVISEGWQWK
jgi:hypothetical protein